MIEADYDEVSIYNAILMCINDKNFRENCLKCLNPYGIGDAGIKIAKILNDTKIEPKKLLRKEMMLSGIEKDGWFQ